MKVPYFLQSERAARCDARERIAKVKLSDRPFSFTFYYVLRRLSTKIALRAPYLLFATAAMFAIAAAPARFFARRRINFSAVYARHRFSAVRATDDHFAVFDELFRLFSALRALKFKKRHIRSFRRYRRSRFLRRLYSFS